jgi:hypothetical protein
VPAGVRVPARGVRAEFGHRAEHGNSAAAVAAGRERLERGRHRDWVRVVGVVDQQAAVRERPLLAPPGRELDRCRAFADPVERQTERGVGCDGGGQRQPVVGKTELGGNRDAGAADREDRIGCLRARAPGERVDVCGRVESEAPLVEVAAPVRIEQLRIRGEDEWGARRQRGDQRGLLGGDRFDAAEELEVLGTDRGDHAELGLGDPAERG